MGITEFLLNQDCALDPVVSSQVEDVWKPLPLPVPLPKVLGGTGHTVAVTIGNRLDSILVRNHFVPEVPRSGAVIIDHEGASYRFYHFHKGPVIILTAHDHEPDAWVSVKFSIWKIPQKFLHEHAMLPLVYELAGPDHCHGLCAGNGRVVFLA